MTREEILAAAKQCVCGDRDQDYGSPETSFNMIAALQQEIEKLRGQVSRWIPVTERLPELQSWGASTVVLGLIKSENAPSLNKLRDLTLCVYCDNGIWSMPGRYAAITHWMPLPEWPEET